MTGGFRRLLHPASVVTAVDLDTSRRRRDAQRQALRQRQEMIDRLLATDTQAPPTS